MNPLYALGEHGQSYWLDNLTRGLIESGELARRVREEGLRGVTSNPSIFNKAIRDSSDYDEALAEAARAGLSSVEIYESLVTNDIRKACDVLAPVYEKTEGRDGYVSLEVSPLLAHDTERSLQEARRLYETVSRPNVMVKIPGTVAGLAAVEQLLYERINVNITLLFSVPRYEAVAQRYLRALERRAEENKSIDDVASVASFFLSRIDVLVDTLLNRRRGPQAHDLLGKAAVASAKLAYQRYLASTADPRWEALGPRSPRVQRLLWASTGAKNPEYSDVAYVEPLIGPDTVNTMPDATIDAFRDHGAVADTLTEGVEEAERVMERLERLGIGFEQVSAQLENEGIQKFIDPYEQLLDHIERACAS